MKTMQPKPDYLNDVWAKSAASGKGDGETLAQHTWNVLSRFSDLVAMRPDLPQRIGVPRLWHRLFWACYLHDLGKSSSGFQAMLRDGESWHFRHEVLSLGFISWLGFDAEDRLWIAGAVASHHKEPDYVARYIRDIEALSGMVESVPEASLAGIWRWLNECRVEWVHNLGLDEPCIEMPQLLSEEEAVNSFKRQGVEHIVAMLKEYRDWADPLMPEYEALVKTPPILLRGLIIQSDHTASAHTKTLEPISISAEGLLAKWPDKVRNHLNAHQEAAREQEGSALLVAPTGSGKTEAALLWAARQADEQGNLPRLFYTLPYQASMNAMQIRLQKSFPENKVGLQHGRSLLALYRQLMDKNYTKKQAASVAKRERNLVRLNFHPVRVFSPYQMLKAFYRLKGYEPFLADYYGAAFIFDEIHAYEPTRLALILKSVQHLRRYYEARFLFMTATFPALIKGKLREALGADVPEIVAGQALYASSQRHRLQLLDGELLEPASLDRIASEAAAGRLVLVCCNTVNRAQQAYKELGERLPEGIERVLLHGRYNGRDRIEREKIVREAIGSTSDKRRPVVLVATQVVEVSLDIDLDTIYTDPAPLEALVQRFGRVNRRGSRPDLAPVYVYREPGDGQGIYDPDHVRGALSVLERVDGQPVDEAAVSGWLDEIYTGEVAQRWEAEYSKAAKEFDHYIVQTLRAFSTADDDLEDRFNKLFDSIEVLPSCLLAAYKAYIGGEDEIEASELLVSISYRQFARIPAEKVVREANMPPVVDLTYDEQGLHFHD